MGALYCSIQRRGLPSSSLSSSSKTLRSPKLRSPSFTFILISLFILLLQLCTPASAATTSGQNPINNPLSGTYGDSGIVEIKWTPTTTGTVTIRLLKGPQKNLVDLGIVYQGENTGSYAWSPQKSLESWESMPSGDIYGLKIIDDITSTFEYSNPFSLSVPDSTYGGAANTVAKTSAATSAKTAATAAATQAPETKKAEETKKTTPTTAAVAPVITNFEIEEAFITVAAANIEEMSATADSNALPVSKTSSASASASTTAAATKGESTNIFAVVAGVICGLALVVAIAILIFRLKKDKKLIANAPLDPKVGPGGIRTPIDPEAGHGTGMGTGVSVGAAAAAGGHRRYNSTSSFGDDGPGARRNSEDFTQRDVVKPQFTGVAAVSASPVSATTPQVNFPAATVAAAAVVPIQSRPQQQRDQYQMQQHPQHTQYPQTRGQQPPYPTQQPPYRGPPVQNAPPYKGQQQQQGGGGGYRPNQYVQPRGPGPAAYTPNGYQARPPPNDQKWPIP